MSRWSQPSAEAECERAVGAYVYNRISALIDAAPDTPEGRELAFLATLVMDVEEYGETGKAPTP